MLAAKFVEFITSKPGVHLYGRDTADKTRRAATFSFTVEGKRSSTIPELVQRDKIAIGSGNFYAKRLIEAFGIKDANDGVVRCSMAHYNTLDEVERLISALDRAL